MYRRIKLRLCRFNQRNSIILCILNSICPFGLSRVKPYCFNKRSIFILCILKCILVFFVIQATCFSCRTSEVPEVKIEPPIIFGPDTYGNYTIQMLPNLEKIINWTYPKYPMNVTYILENDQLCTSVKNLSVLITVNSATDHFDRRQSIRKTWANNEYYAHLGTVKVLFLLGMNTNPAVQTGIEKESEIFGDILQGDFIDSYLNLTHKGVMGFKWITERCRNPKMVLKLDDDFVINMFLYFRKLNEILQSINVYCELLEGRIQRNTLSKWYVNDNHFRGETHYKRYCEGKFVSMTNDIIPYLYESAIKTPFFPYDDVLLFGYVMHNIPGLRYRSEIKGRMTLKSEKGMECLNQLKDKCEIFVMAANSADEMKETWSNIVNIFQNTL